MSIDLAGGLTPSGEVFRFNEQAVEGSITPSGALDYVFIKDLSGPITPTGALDIVMSTDASGEFTSSGSLSSAVSKYVDGDVTFIGELFTSGYIVASITPTGSLTMALDMSIDLDGALTSAGTIEIKNSRDVAGAITFDGALKLGFKPEGVITPTGALSLYLEMKRDPAGALTPTGSAAINTAKALVGDITFRGRLVRVLSVSVFPVGVLTPSGDPSRIAKIGEPDIKIWSKEDVLYTSSRLKVTQVITVANVDIVRTVHTL